MQNTLPSQLTVKSHNQESFLILFFVIKEGLFVACSSVIFFSHSPIVMLFSIHTQNCNQAPIFFFLWFGKHMCLTCSISFCTVNLFSFFNLCTKQQFSFTNLQFYSLVFSNKVNLKTTQTVIFRTETIKTVGNRVNENLQKSLTLNLLYLLNCI